MNDLPRRHLSRPVWHQTQPGNTLLQFEDPATYDGRYHRAGGPGAWYASLTERGAWAERFRHWGQHAISPFEVRRRVGRARATDLVVLDLTDPAVRKQLGVTEGELMDDNLKQCQKLAERARAAGFEGVLAPLAPSMARAPWPSSPTQWPRSSPSTDTCNDHQSGCSTCSRASTYRTS